MTFTETNTPHNKNIIVSAMYTVYFQNVCTACSESTSILVLPNAAINNPNATKAITPDNLIPKSTNSAT